MALLGAALGALPLLALGAAGAADRRSPPGRAWLPLALPAILVQTAAEELAFRGYLMQGLAARFRSPLVWWLLPALLFGAAALEPGRVRRRTPGSSCSPPPSIGLVLADVTARTGNLSAAIGLHFANNVIALLVVALPSPLAGLSLWLAPRRPGRHRRAAPAPARRPRHDARRLRRSGSRFRARRRRLHSQGPRFYLDGRPPPEEPARA